MFLETLFLVQVALIPIFIQEFHLSIFEVSLVATVPALVQLLMNFPSGFFADHLNTKHLLFVSMLVEGIAALLVSQMNNFLVLVLAVSLMRMVAPLYHISALSQISRFVNRDKINRAMGFHNALGGLGSAIGLVSLALVLSTTNWRMIYILWSVPLIVWGLILLASRSMGTANIQPARSDKLAMNKLSLLFSAEFLVFMTVIALRAVEFSGTQTFMTTYLVDTRGVSEATASLIFGLGPFLGMMGSLAGGYLGEKTGAKRAATLSMIGCIISLVFLAFATNIFALTLIYQIYAFFGASVWSPMTSLVADVTPVTGRGIGYSVYFFVEGTMNSLTPAIAAVLIGMTEIWFIFPFSIISVSLSAFLLQYLRITRKRQIP